MRINISDKHKTDLVDFYLLKYKEAVAEVESVKGTLLELGYSFPTDERPALTGYDPSATWKQRIEFILSQFEQSLTSAQIAEEIAEQEPEKEKSSILASVSATLSTYSKTDTDLFQKSTNLRGEKVYQLRPSFL